MEITRRAKPATAKTDVSMWHCSGCGVVHMAVGEEILNLEHEQLAGIREAIIRLDAAEGSFSLIGLIADKGLMPVLESGETVH